MAKGGKGKGGNGGDGGGTPVGDLTIVGTQGADRLSGGAGTDRITGRGGDDIINGGEGVDTAVYAGSITDYSWSYDRKGRLIITDENTADGDEGTDRLSNVEVLEFSDYSYLLNANNPTVFSVDPIVTTVNEEVTFSFSVFDLDNRSLQYQGFTFDPTTQGFLTNESWVTESLGTGEIQTRTMTFDPSTVDRSELAEGESAFVTFDFRVGTNTGGYVDAQIVIEVVGINDAPTLAADGVVDVTEDEGPVTFDLSALGADVDSDDDGQSLQYTLLGVPDGLNITLNGSELIVDPGAGFQSLNTGETETLTIQVQATDAHGATSAVQDVRIVVHGADDAVPVYLTADGDIDYTALGADPRTAPHAGVLEGLSDDPAFVALTAFTQGDDVRTIHAERLETFSNETFLYSYAGTQNYQSLGFDMMGGDDLLAVALDGVNAFADIVDIQTGDGEDVVVFDLKGQAFAAMSGVTIDTGAQNDQVLIDMQAHTQIGFSGLDVLTGEGNDIVNIRAVQDGGSDPLGAGALIGGTDIYLGDGRDTLLIDLQISGGTTFGGARIDIDAGHGADEVTLSTGSSLTGGAEVALGLDGSIDLGTGDDFLFLDLDAATAENELLINGGYDYHLGPTGGYDVVVLTDGTADDYTLIERYPGSYTLTRADQVVYLQNIEELLLADGTNLFDTLV